MNIDEKFKGAVEKLSQERLIRSIGDSYFVEVIANRKLPDLDFVRSIVKEFMDSVGARGTLWSLEVHNKVSDAFTRRARLHVIGDGYGAIPTSTVSGRDAYVKMREIDSAYLDYAGHHSDEAETIEVELVQDQEGGFAQFIVNQNERYVEIEVGGQSHKVVGGLTVNSAGRYVVKVEPLPFRVMGFG